MIDPKLPSRRDWFRLRTGQAPTPTPTQYPSLGDARSTIEVGLLKSIEHPPNHDGLDLNELPPMREALLSKDQVKSLLDDIAMHATDVQLMQRATNARMATAQVANSSDQLRLAVELLLKGDIHRLQIRYRWTATLWIDTLKRDADSFQLVRIAHRTDQ